MLTCIIIFSKFSSHRSNCAACFWIYYLHGTVISWISKRFKKKPCCLNTYVNIRRSWGKYVFIHFLAQLSGPKFNISVSLFKHNNYFGYNGSAMNWWTLFFFFSFYKLNSGEQKRRSTLNPTTMFVLSSWLVNFTSH